MRRHQSRYVAERRLLLESLEDRELLAVYLPDTFADVRAQPVALSYRGGEQLLALPTDACAGLR